jgi:pimeloyl-ACP methyl ester carboxylesterase
MKMYRLVALAGLAFVLPHILHAQAPAPAPASAAPAETRLAHISVQSIGGGDPVVLIPGLASPRAVWDGIAPALAAHHRVLLVQVNGFGGDDPGANASEGLLSGVVADIVRYLDDNHIPRAAVVGHSMGGLIGMMLAKDHPDRVAKLMIVDSLPFFGVLVAPDATVDSVRPVAARMRDTVANGHGDQAAPPNMSLTDAGRARVAAWLNASNRAAVGEALYEDMTTDLRGDVPAIGRVPTTVLYAVPDPAMAAMFRGVFAGAYAAAPSIRVVPIEGSAHFIMLDQPERFRQAVDAFLAG